MIKLQYLDKKISEVLIQERNKRDEEHIPSGKLSASMLWQPLQWAVLKTIGVPQAEKDEYVLRKFKRGNHVEDWLVSHMNALDTQKFVEYKDAIGFIDALVDSTEWGLNFGIVPHEVKSVTNLKYKRIQSTGPDKSHILQAGFYALADLREYFAIDYVASDDYRIETYLFEARDYKAEIDSIIDRYNTQLKSGIVPVFYANEKWQENPEYNNYMEFRDLNVFEIMELLKTKYPESYKKLEEYGKNNN